MVLQRVEEEYRNSGFSSYRFAEWTTQLTQLERKFEALYDRIHPVADLGIKGRMFQYNHACHSGDRELEELQYVDTLTDDLKVKLLIEYNYELATGYLIKFNTAFKNRYDAWTTELCSYFDLIPVVDPKATHEHRLACLYLRDFLGIESSVSDNCLLTQGNNTVSIPLKAFVVQYTAELYVTHTLSEDGSKIITRYTRSGTSTKIKVEYKIGRWVSRYLLCPPVSGVYEVGMSFSNRDGWVEGVTNLIKSWYLEHGTKDSLDIEVEEHVGSDIWTAYNAYNYMDRDDSNDLGIDLGDLHDSCMRHAGCENYIIGWYGNALGPEVVKCLALWVDGKVVARGLLWNVEGAGWMIDRIYGGEAARKMLIGWCKERGIHSCKYKEGYTLEMDLKARARVKDYFLSEYGNFPYCDTFYCVYYNDDGCIVMSSSRTRGVSALMSNAGDYYKLCALQDTEGSVCWSLSDLCPIWGTERCYLSAGGGYCDYDDETDYDEE